MFQNSRFVCLILSIATTIFIVQIQLAQNTYLHAVKTLKHAIIL